MVQIPSRGVYFDHNATTPVDAGVLARLKDWAEAFGNPSSIHWAGRAPKALLRSSRRSIAAWLTAQPLEIVFTSGGSEANNLAIMGVFQNLTPQDFRSELIVSAVEHPSVMKTAEALERKGFRVHRIRVNRDGDLDVNQFDQVLSDRTALVSIMYANNETGHIFPIRELCADAHASGALFHCDGVQALGKTNLSLKELNVDLASFSAHKAYALKGSGFLFARQGVNLESLIRGGGQERGRRAGTENILSIAALGHMAEVFQKESFMEHTRELRDTFERRLQEELPGIEITGATGGRISNTSSLMIEGIDGETLLMNLDVKGYAVSTGAACSAGSPEPSPVLLAMGYSREEAQRSLRVSFGKDNTLEEMNAFVDTLKEVVSRLRQLKKQEPGWLYGS